MSEYSVLNSFLVGIATGMATGFAGGYLAYRFIRRVHQPHTEKIFLRQRKERLETLLARLRLFDQSIVMFIRAYENMHGKIAGNLPMPNADQRHEHRRYLGPFLKDAESNFDSVNKYLSSNAFETVFEPSFIRTVYFYTRSNIFSITQLHEGLPYSNSGKRILHHAESMIAYFDGDKALKDLQSVTEFKDSWRHFLRRQ